MWDFIAEHAVAGIIGLALGLLIGLGIASSLDTWWIVIVSMLICGIIGLLIKEVAHVAFKGLLEWISWH